jgi:hypothetical protein
MSDEQPFKVGDRVVYDPAAPLNTSEPLSSEYEVHHEIMNAPELEILGVEGGHIYQYLTFALWSDDQYAASRFKSAPTEATSASEEREGWLRDAEKGQG